MRIPLISKFPVSVVLFQKRGTGASSLIDNARFVVKDGVRVYELKKYGVKFQPSSFDDFVPLNTGKPMVLLYEYQRDMVVPITVENLTKIFEVNKKGQVRQEYVEWECTKGHEFKEPMVIETGVVTKGEKEVCPYCRTDLITKLPEKKLVKKIKKIINLHAIEEDMAFWGQLRRQQAERRHKTESWIQKYKDLLMMMIVFVFFIVIAYIFMNNISENTRNIVDVMTEVLVSLKQSAPPG